MNKIAIERRICCSSVQMVYFQRREKIVHESRNVALKVLYPQRGIVGPKILVEEKCLTERSFPTDYDARSPGHRSVVVAFDPTARHDGHFAVPLVVFCNVE